MFQKERQDAILEILKDQGYATVKYLTQKLHYSTATINRDLNELEKQKLIKRSYGGAEPVERHSTPLPYRYDKMRTEKRLIGHTAAEFIKAGETVFIDGSTTTQSMAQDLLEVEGLTVITNNMALAGFLSEHGVDAICLGGRVQEPPSMLDGNETVLNAASYHADKMFFSTGGVTADGRIGTGVYQLLHHTMAQNSDQVFFLVDHQKICSKMSRYLFDFSRVDYVISDHEFSAETKQKYPSTEFVFVGK